ncbi:hypothetical protein HHK36_009845 [Tetracentron sinense]|uniref:Uncharacterized protein n=1 Tax=Tetracentron sinense TaxID=13715 RepID=A0A834ZGG7_TETSI|nr:hypothetical protein HHK36_009845 [Tetracentron sinense]
MVGGNSNFPMLVHLCACVRKTFWLFSKGCYATPSLYLILFFFLVHCSGNKWILNILSGKCFISAPHQKLCIYQHTKYHKQTKNQWARDDPAFVVICSLLLVVATSAYCAAYAHSVAHAVFTVIAVLVFHFLATGVILATCCWFLTNSYLREETPNSHVVEQRVEWQVMKPYFFTILDIIYYLQQLNKFLIQQWHASSHLNSELHINFALYAFDVHCNSFFPMFVMLYVIHYFLSPLLVAHGFIPVLLSNLLFMVAFSYYHYLNFLGYDGKQILILSIILFFSYMRNIGCTDTLLSIGQITAVLPFLDKTTFFLYPIGLVIILSPLCNDSERFQPIKIYYEHLLQLAAEIH